MTFNEIPIKEKGCIIVYFCQMFLPVKRLFFPLTFTKRLLTRSHLFSRHLEANVVVWCYINKIALNWISSTIPFLFCNSNIFIYYYTGSYCYLLSEISHYRSCLAKLPLPKRALFADWLTSWMPSSSVCALSVPDDHIKKTAAISQK